MTHYHKAPPKLFVPTLQQHNARKSTTTTARQKGHSDNSGICIHQKCSDTERVEQFIRILNAANRCLTSFLHALAYLHSENENEAVY